jgi:hypothetical protein
LATRLPFDFDFQVNARFASFAGFLENPVLVESIGIEVILNQVYLPKEVITMMFAKILRTRYFQLLFSTDNAFARAFSICCPSGK